MHVAMLVPPYPLLISAQQNAVYKIFATKFRIFTSTKCRFEHFCDKMQNFSLNSSILPFLSLFFVSEELPNQAASVAPQKVQTRGGWDDNNNDDPDQIGLMEVENGENNINLK